MDAIVERKARLFGRKLEAALAKAKAALPPRLKREPDSRATYADSLERERQMLVFTLEKRLNDYLLDIEAELRAWEIAEKQWLTENPARPDAKKIQDQS